MITRLVPASLGFPEAASGPHSVPAWGWAATGDPDPRAVPYLEKVIKG